MRYEFKLVRSAVLGLACSLSVAACVSGGLSDEPGGATASQGDVLLGAAAPLITAGRPERVTVSELGSAAPRPQGFVSLGREALPNADQRQGSGAVSAGGEGYSLNFVDVDIQEFVRSVFDEVLHENVVIDPTLTGHITVRTNQPVSKAIAQTLVQDALRASGASVSKSGQLWQVSAGGNQAGRARETVRVLPLRFIDAASARLALQPFNAGGAAETVIGGNGRFLIVSGRSSDVDAIEQVVATLDVDELRGRSFALLPLKEATAAAVAKDLGQMLATSGAPSARVITIERMNAVMVITSDSRLIARVQGWVARLDRTGQDQRRMFVYPVRNRRAVELAKVLEGLLAKGNTQSAASGPESTVAPTLSAQQMNSPSIQGQRMDAALGGEASKAESSPFGTLDASQPSLSRPQAIDDSVEVRADPATNSLVVVCRQERYAAVQATIRALDILPAQVLIEVTIAEVQLNAALDHGVRWFFQTGHHSFGLTNNSVTPSFTYSLGLPNAQLALEALESVTHVNIVSSPALTVMDNQTATLKVGDQVPIATRSSQSTISPDAPIVNDITLKDTGIILQVTPRVNSSGLVLLDINQEDSDVVPTTTSGINSPTIRQRTVTSSVAVQSGAEIVLGGIISHSTEHDKSGVPIINEIPLIGSLLANNESLSNKRTELLVILRPTIMANQAEVAAVTAEIRAKMSRP